MKYELQNIFSDIVLIDNADVNGQSFFQSPAWARVKSQFGWSAVSFKQTRYEHLQSDVLVLLKKIKFLGYLAYAPDALLPLDVRESGSSDTYRSLLEQTADVLFDAARVIQHQYGRKVFALRYDAPWVLSSAQTAAAARHAPPVRGLRAGHKGIMLRSSFVQPPATVLLDLLQSEDDLLSGMKSKTRYNVRLAHKHGVVIFDSVSVDDFYELYQTTSARNKISIHSKAYYQAVVEAARIEKQSDVFLYGARYNEKIIAAIAVVHHAPHGGKKRAVYLYGASANEHRSFMPAYALQWHAIRQAKKLGCISYDLFGIPLMRDAKDSSLHGLVQFKTGFGGIILERGGGFVCISARFSARITNTLFCCAERVRASFIKKNRR